MSVITIHVTSITVPILKNQIAMGEPVTVTGPRENLCQPARAAAVRGGRSGGCSEGLGWKERRRQDNSWFCSLQFASSLRENIAICRRL
jgi:hypothetical protein